MAFIEGLLYSMGFALVAFALGYFIWYKTRPKKKTWKAYVWKKSDSFVPPVKNKKGEKVNQGELKDMRFYGIDTIEKTENKQGSTIYRLQKLNKTIPEPKGDAELEDVINNSNQGFVNVLYDNDSCTIIRAGYDEETGRQIWEPLPYDMVTSLKSDINTRKQRFQNKKDLLQQLAPYVMGILVIIGMIAVVYFVADAGITMSENFVKSTEKFTESQEKMHKKLRQTLTDLYNEEKQNKEKNEKLNKEEIPSLE